MDGTAELTGLDVDENEWWIKSLRAVNGVEKEYDFPPHVVRVHSQYEITHEETLDGVLTLRDSPWDPYTELLPMEELISARPRDSEPQAARDQPRRSSRSDLPSGPYADTIGGSRWPGQSGGPRRS